MFHTGSYAAESAEECAEPFRLEPLTARAMSELPDPETDDRLLGPLVVREQRCVIGAHTGHGKTTLTMQILGAITERRPFLDWAGVGGRALVIDAEQGLRTIKRRLREAQLDQSENVDYVRVPDGLELNCNAAHIAEVERVIADGNYSVVFADPLYKLHVGDSNAEREAVDLMRRLDAWRAQYRFALILSAHCRKPPIGSKFSMHEFFGSTAYLRGAEVVLGLQRVGDGYAQLHFFKDRDGDLPLGQRWGLLFTREEGFRRDPNSGKDKPTTKDKIEELLTNKPGMTVEELMGATGAAERTVNGALKQLGAKGDGRHPSRYMLPTEPADEQGDLGL